MVKISNIPGVLKRQLKLVWHKGTKYECPFCHYQSKDMAPIGLAIPVLSEKEVVGGGRRAAGCHKCGSSDRERLVYVYLKDKLRIFSSGKNKSLLHIAPEKKISQLLLDAHLDLYVCGDLFTEGYDYPEHVQNINILNIPYDDNTFDLIICNHVLEHIPTDIDAMKELCRVLKTGGKAVLQVPISKNSGQTFEDFHVIEPKQREMIFGQFDHFRIYGQDYVNRLEASGFKVNRINISKEFAKNGLNMDEDLFICEK